MHLLSCSFTKIHQRDMVSCTCYRVVSQRFTTGIWCLASVIMQFHKGSPEGYSVLHLFSCSFTMIHQRDIVSCICYHVLSQRYSWGIYCLASVIMQFHKDSPEGYCVLDLLACSFTNILQREIVSCICYHVVSQRFIRRIQCLASVSMQFHKYSPEGYSVLHLLSCIITKIPQGDIFSCICYRVVSQRFTSVIQCPAPVIMLCHQDSPEVYSVLHLFSCSFAKIHQRDLVSCICQHVVSQLFSRGIQCLASVIMQFRKDSSDGSSVLHLLACSFTNIHQRDIVSCMCYHGVSQRLTGGIQCFAFIIIYYHKHSPGGYIVLHLLSCSFAEIHQRDIVSCICQHVVSQIFPRGMQCLASVIIWLRKDSPEGYSVQHLLSCIITNIHQRDIVSCICYHVVSQRFTRGIQCLAPVFMQFHNDSPEGYSVLHLLS